MSHFKTSDDTELFYSDWGSGQPIVFVNSWGLDTRVWSPHMLRLNALGYRCIAFDRRGHGRSDDPGRGYDYDRLVDDLAELLDRLDLHEVTLVALSMGTGECTHYLARHGKARIARAVYLGSLAPSYVESSREPHTMDDLTSEHIIADMQRNLPQWLADNVAGFFLPVETGVTENTMRHTIDIVLNASPKALVECFRTFRVDQRDELRSIDLPLLVIHGDRDASQPVQHGRAVAELVPDSRYIEYGGAPHGLYLTHADRLLADVLDFIRATPSSESGNSLGKAAVTTSARAAASRQDTSSNGMA